MIPDPVCYCCVCQGIHCFLPHPGHAHQLPVIARTPDIYESLLVKRK